MNRRFNRTIRIPVEIDDEGKPAWEFKTPWPIMRKGARGFLILDESDVEDAHWKQILNRSVRIPLTSSGARVALAVNPEKTQHTEDVFLTNAQMEFLFEDPQKKARVCRYWGNFWVEVFLTRPLLLEMRGTRASILRGGNCHVPILDQKKLKAEFTSLNLAYTAISQCFETKRLGHTGDVFRDGLLWQNGEWIRFETLRLQKELEEWQRRVELANIQNGKVDDAVLGGIFLPQPQSE